MDNSQFTINNSQLIIVYTLISFLLFGCSGRPILPTFLTTTTPNLETPCWQNTLKIGNSPTLTRQLDKKIFAYQSLVEQSLTSRIKTINLAKRLKSYIAQDKPLSGSDLDQLNRGMLIHLQLREKLYRIAEAHECWLDTSEDIFAEYGIEPISPQNRLKGIMLSLSAALMLYDNYLLAISIFEEDSKLRRFLNQRDSGYDIGRDELTKVSKSYYSYRKRNRVKKALEFYENQLDEISKSLYHDTKFKYLKLLIEQSPSYNMTKKYSPLYAINEKLQFLGEVSEDILQRFTSEGLDLFSKFFGNSVGLIETRKGKLYNRSDVLKTITRQLKTGDILLEKTPFRLTDKFIPGHWGHAAIWLGTEAELKNLGIWNHPLVTNYHEQISQGHAVVEALRSGVEVNPLEKFLNIDDLAILRNPNFDRKTFKQYITLALRQVGKDYDFNFDVETTDKIVCSELIYTVFVDIEWPTEKTLGRFTISPDNIASKTFNNGPLKLVTLFHDGELVTKRPLEFMAQLMLVKDS